MVGAGDTSGWGVVRYGSEMQCRLQRLGLADVQSVCTVLCDSVRCCRRGRGRTDWEGGFRMQLDVRMSAEQRIRGWVVVCALVVGADALIDEVDGRNDVVRDGVFRTNHIYLSELIN